MPFRSDDNRNRFARILCRVVSPTQDAEPYITASDTYHWSIDPAGNNWWVGFCEEDPSVFRISCRYPFQSEVLSALVPYIAARLACEVVSPG